MKYIKPINEIWGPILKRDLLGETREEDKFYTKDKLMEYLKSEIEKQGENVVIRNLDVSHIEDLRNLFRDIAVGVKSLDLSGWKTSGVKYMDSMFFECRKLKSLDLSGWDTSNVIFTSCMFYNCQSLESLDLSGWNTSRFINISYMFWGCKSLESLDLSGWNLSNIITAKMVFYDCPAPYEVINNKIVKK